MALEKEASVLIDLMDSIRAAIASSATDGEKVMTISKLVDSYTLER
jgi:hypothetical protein